MALAAHGYRQRRRATGSTQEVVVDENLVTSRKPEDIPAFNREMIALIRQLLRSAASAPSTR